MDDRTQVTYKLFDKQFTAYNFRKQFCAIIAGVQSGKTHTGAVWSIKKISEFPTKDGLIVAPSYKILQQSTLRKLFTLFPQYRAFYKEQKSVIELPTGGTVFIRSMDKPLGAEGTTASWIWADELGQSPVMAWTILRSRVAMTGGQIMITTTPYNMGWLYQNFYLPWKRGEDPNLTVYSWKSIENPWFPRETYESERMRLSTDEFSRRYMGEFSKPHGLVYQDFNESHIVSPKKIDGYTIAGVDFGYTNPAAIVVLRYNLEDKNWYVIDEWYHNKRTQDEINVAAIALQKQYNIRKFFPDNAEPDRIQSMRNVGLTCYEVNKDVAGGINRVREFIRFNQFFVFSTCHNTLDELASYHYAEQKEANKAEPKTLEAPVKEYDHALDAIRMALYSDNPMAGHKNDTETRFSKDMKKLKSKNKPEVNRTRGY